jgi:PKD repeat protein
MPLPSGSAPPYAAIALVALVLGLSTFAVALPSERTPVTPAPVRGSSSASFEGNLEVGLAQESLLAQPSLHAHPALPPPPPPPPLSPGGFEWANLTPRLSVSPSARLGDAMAWDPADGYVLLYGGVSASDAALGDTWSFSNGTWTNLTGEVSGSPPALIVANLAYDPSDHEMILFGGENSSSVIQNQTWSYHDRIWTNLTGHTGAAPPGAVLAAMTTDTAGSDILLFGGQSALSSTWLNDTWSFKSGAWTNLSALARAPAGALIYPSATDDPAIGGVALYAVFGLGAGIAAATLQFTGGTWHNLTGIAGGDSGQMILDQGGYLASLGAATFVSTEAWNSSFGTSLVSNTVEYSNQNWTNVTSSVGGPPAVGLLGSVCDLPSDTGLMAFGGENDAGLLSQTWVLTAPPQLTVSVAHIVTDVGVSDAFNSTVTGGFGAISYHWNFGDGTNSSSAGSGHAFSHSGRYQANLTVTDALGHRVSSSLWVQVEGALSANVSASPVPATAGSPVALIGGWSGGTAPYSFAWSLGDLNGSTASSLAHTYAKAGNYSVSFTVTDALGQKATGTLTVEVRAAASTTSSTSSSSVSLTSGTGLYLLLGIVLLAVIAAVLAVLLARRPRSPPGPPAPYGGAPPSVVYGGPAAPPPPGPPPAT